MAEKTYLKTTLAISILLVLLGLCGTAHAEIIYVDDDATGANNGSSWADAYSYLQDALADANSGDEIWVAQGIYKPDQGIGITPGERTATFQLINGVAIKGGYAGFGEPDPDARHIRNYETILSGDINGDDVSVNDPCDMRTEPTRAENSFHVVTGSGTDQTAILDGFTITGGQADGSFPRSHGGGIHNFHGSPTVFNCKIDWNYASGGGGGVSSEGEPTFTNCWFYRSRTGGSGGGLYVWGGSATINGCTFYKNSAWWGGGFATQYASATVTGCIFRGNLAQYGGGGMCYDGGTYTLTDCTFRDNSAAQGGAVWNIDCTAGLWDNPVVSNCIFTGNSASEDGGGMFNSASTPTVVGCTFESNSAQFFGGGVYNEDGSAAVFESCAFNSNRSEVRGGGMCNHGSSPTLTNCTLGTNSAEDGGGMYTRRGSPIMTNCSFSGNSAVLGGGMYTWRGSPTLTNCTFTGNSVGTWYGRGGGMYNNGYEGECNPILINCVFIRNEAEYDGGGICNSESSPTVTNCIFSGNAAKYGGMMYNWRSSPILINCTIFGNSADHNGGGIYNSYNGNPTLGNCILYNNSDEAGTVESSQVHDTAHASTVSNYSCIQGWTGNPGGTGNIGDAPLFVDADGADNVIGTDDDNLRLLPGSLCIDAGDNSSVPPSVLTDLDGDPRIANGTVDMGAYEGPTQGFLLNTQSLTVPEDQTATFTVALAMDPLGTVQVTVTHVSGDGDISVQSGALLYFDSSNYSEPQTVTLSAAEDENYFNGVALIWVSAPRFFTAGVSVSEWDNDAPAILYVDGKATGVNNGSSWVNAFTDLQDALSLATVVPQIEEIHVAQGLYTPAERSGDRTATFQLINGVTIKGGYAGFGEPDPNARDTDAYQTILSGDLNGDDGPDFANNDENSFHVVIGSGTDETAVLDGFTITGGNGNRAYGQGNEPGGGMINRSGSPTVTNCIFSANVAGYGGAMYNNGSSPTISDCTFSANLAFLHDAEERPSGGGMYNYRSSPTITNCTFTGNSVSASYHGGGDGGGIFCGESSPTLVNCIISGNSARRYGGGMTCWWGGSPMLTNCTFSRNSAGEDGGGLDNYEDNPTVTNCILWANTPVQIYVQRKGTPVITYSNVQGGWDGEGNIDADPCFAEPGYWANANEPNIVVEPNDPNAVWVDGDYHLLLGSPCINTGDPNYIAEPNETDLDGRPRVIGGRIDMGAYEYSPPIPAEVRIVPRTINLTSRGKWITCYIWLPEDYNVADIDPNSIVLEDEVQAESLRVDEGQQVAIAKFNRSEVHVILDVGEVELTITGQLTNGTIFEATDIIRVLNKAGLNQAK